MRAERTDGGSSFCYGCIEVMFTPKWYSLANKNKWRLHQDFQHRTVGPDSAAPYFRIAGQSEIFGIRFYPAAAAFLLKEEIHQFNNNVFDLTSVLGNSISELHAQLQDAPSTKRRIELVDAYLLKKLAAHTKTLNRIDLVQQVMNELTHKDFFDNINNVAERYGISSRLLAKSFPATTPASRPSCMHKSSLSKQFDINRKRAIDHSLPLLMSAAILISPILSKNLSHSPASLLPVLNSANSSATLASPNK